MSVTEQISVALAINDNEDRDLVLQKISKELIAEKDLDKAIGVSHFIENSYEKVETLHWIAENLAKSGDLERSFWFFNEAENEAIRCSELWQQAELLHKLAKTLFEVGAKNKADTFWQKSISICKTGENLENLQSNLDASSVFAEIVIFISKNVDFHEGLQIAQTIKNNHFRERTLTNLANYQSQIKLVA
jgi:hypothetical protein